MLLLVLGISTLFVGAVAQEETTEVPETFAVSSSITIGSLMISQEENMILFRDLSEEEGSEWSPISFDLENNNLVLNASESGGNVGIGVADPLVSLDVLGSARFSGQLLIAEFDTENAPESLGAGALYFDTDQDALCVRNAADDAWKCESTEGPVGPQGDAGPQGESGVAGAQGPQGEPGSPGMAGPQGEQGLQGIPGPAGAQGQQGDRGLQGIPGLAGATGPTGFQGPQGAAGPPGPQGFPGLPGQNGVACWDLNQNGITDLFEDVNNDFAVNVLDCKGPQGNTGPPGAPSFVNIAQLDILYVNANAGGDTMSGTLTADSFAISNGWTFGIVPGNSGRACFSVVSCTVTLRQNGELRVEGDLVVVGNKNFAQAHPTDSTKEIVYVSLEGPEAGTYIRGTAELVNGEALIKLPEYFSLVTSDEQLTVQVTPNGEWLQLFVVEKDAKQLLIREATGRSGQFDYFVQGIRIGFEQHQVIRTKNE
jgi:hypothetical protein